MKLSFSLAKTAAYKKVTGIQIQESTDITERREVVAISVDEGIIVNKTEEDLEFERVETLVIPCKTLYTAREKRSNNVQGTTDFSIDVAGPRPIGLILNPSQSVPANNEELVPAKKGRSSILMQIMEARKRGEVQDAPLQPIRSLDANEFGWALLRGMGYDESKETAVDTKATETVVGNRAKLGIGVKLETLKK